MKVTLEIEGRVFGAVVPYDGADHAVVEGYGCTHCNAAPMKVGGTENHVESHDTYAARAHCMACGAHVGTLRARMSTIFGIEEDARVLNGRARVY